MSVSAKLPTLYLPHGSPRFFIDWDPPDTWTRLVAWLRSINGSLPARPKALLVVSAHWEAPVPTVTSSASPPLVYDYYGFPPHMYELRWPSPGAPELAGRVHSLLSGARIESQTDARRGFDHGVFVPMMVAYPNADVPTAELSLCTGLDPTLHLAVGRALAPLREEGVFLIGSGMSYHNRKRTLMSQEALEHSKRFDAWLTGAVTTNQLAREEALTCWHDAPSARDCHPREEHLLPLMVVAGAGGADAAHKVFQDQVRGVVVSGFQFG